MLAETVGYKNVADSVLPTFLPSRPLCRWGGQLLLTEITCSLGTNSWLCETSQLSAVFYLIEKEIPVDVSLKKICSYPKYHYSYQLNLEQHSALNRDVAPV